MSGTRLQLRYWPIQCRPNRNRTYLLCLFLTSSVLASCASLPPENLILPKNTAAVPLTSSAMEANIGQTVRWGGVIIEVKNNQQGNHIIVLGYPLSSRARPNIYYRSSKRFIAEFPSFIEPTDYTEGREITIIGSIKTLQQDTIKQYGYAFPVINVTSDQLWSIRRAGSAGYPYYGPVYSPFYNTNYWGHGYGGHHGYQRHHGHH